MRSGGFALACRSGNESTSIPLPPWCPSQECREQRDEDALERAIHAGVIDP
jgi:hypothetical protein